MNQPKYFIKINSQYATVEGGDGEFLVKTVVDPERATKFLDLSVAQVIAAIMCTTEVVEMKEEFIVTDDWTPCDRTDPARRYLIAYAGEYLSLKYPNVFYFVRHSDPSKAFKFVLLSDAENFVKHYAPGHEIVTFAPKVVTNWVPINEYSSHDSSSVNT